MATVSNRCVAARPMASANALGVAPDGFADLLARTQAWLQHTAEPRALVALDDPTYPSLLLQTADPPLLLHAVGRLELLEAPSLAIVGSRNPTPQGRDHAASFGRQISQAIVLTPGCGRPRTCASANPFIRSSSRLRCSAS